MKKIAFMIAAASLFAVGPLTQRLGPVPSAAALVCLGVLVAMAASGAPSSLAITAGALGALGAGILGPVSPAAAGALLVAAAFAERTTRVRTKNGRAIHVMAAVLGGALAGSLSGAFGGASPAVLAVAVVVAAVVSALPLLVDADDPLAHALEVAARSVSEPARAALLSGAELRRSAEDVPLDRATAVRVKKTWQALLRLAEARLRLERSRGTTALPALPAGQPSAADAVLGMVDQRIAEHVTALGKAITAVDTARAAAASLDDAELRSMETMGDSLEDVSRALVDGGTDGHDDRAQPLVARVAS
ncbi:MAG: hypothetical protein JWP97_4680 [Labilithrix sp.]|nr:hypothetical protein [Labilithrix sp.]